MGDAPHDSTLPPPECMAAVDAVCDQYEAACSEGPPPIAPYLDRVTETCRVWLGYELLVHAAGALQELGQPAEHDDLRLLFGEAHVDFERAWRRYARNQPDLVAGIEPRGALPCPKCNALLPTLPDAADGEIVCRSCRARLVLDRSPAGKAILCEMIRHYRLVEKVGEGAFGEVWKAYDTKLRRHAALKIPRAGLTDTRLLATFRREARKTAQLRHSDIVQVHQVLEYAGKTIIVSEYVDGEPLESRLQRGPFDLRDAVQLLARIARAVHYAHECDIVHRDLKPANVLLDSQGNPHLIDFNLARSLAGDTFLSIQGDRKGTPLYMSPEQAGGSGHQADGRSDVYTLGVMLFELLTGELPFRGKRRTDLRKMSREGIYQMILEVPPPKLRDCGAEMPADLETIVAKCLEKLPAHRVQTAELLADELGRFLRGEPILHRPLGRLELAWRWSLRHPDLAASGLTLLAILFIGLIVVTGLWRRAEHALHARDIADFRGFLTAAPAIAYRSLPGLSARMEQLQSVVAAQLADDQLSPSEQARARLLTLAKDPAQWKPLCEYFFSADLTDAWLFRDALVEAAERNPQLASPDVGLAHAGADRDFRRFLLFAGTSIGKGQVDWRQEAHAACRQWIDIVDRDPKLFSLLLDMLWKCRPLLIEPLNGIYCNDQEDPNEQRQRIVATMILRELSAPDAELRAELLLAAAPWQIQALSAGSAPHWPPEQLERLHRVAAGQAATPGAPGLECEPATLRANASLLLVLSGDEVRGWDNLARVPDPTIRSLIIERCAAWGVTARHVKEALEQLPSPDIRSGLLMCLGKCTPSALDDPLLTQLRSSILNWYEHDPDPEVHAAARWLLQQRGWRDEARQAEIDQRLASAADAAAATRRWYVAANGHTMVICGPVSFTMGNPGEIAPGHDSFERPHTRFIHRRFAVAMHETTLAQFKKLAPHWPPEPDTTDDQCPASGVSWQQAVRYCNWLTSQADLPATENCYEPLDSGSALLREAEDALERRGYRLPTEAEWEYVCRAGTSTPLYFGAASELLARYECCIDNSDFGRRRAVGLGLPNQAGLFDIMGNACEWCHDPFGEFPPTRSVPWPDNGRPHRWRIGDESQAEQPAWQEMLERGAFVLRGHGAGDPDDYQRYFRDSAPPNYSGGPSIGFRIARTVVESAP